MGYQLCSNEVQDSYTATGVLYRDTLTTQETRRTQQLINEPFFGFQTLIFLAFISQGLKIYQALS